MFAIVHQDKEGQWYFWDEVGYYEYGPYPTQEEAQEKLEEYCKELNYSREEKKQRMMKKRLEEMERNMRSILKEVNKTFGAEYRNFEASLWPTKSEPFKINFWDGLNHAPLSQTDYAGTPEELIEWVTKRKILFQKFDKVL